MRARLVLAGSATALLCLGGVASAGAPDSPVKVTRNNGGVQVTSQVGGQPLVGASADKFGVCVGFSYQIPFCLPLSFG